MTLTGTRLYDGTAIAGLQHPDGQQRNRPRRGDGCLGARHPGEQRIPGATITSTVRWRSAAAARRTTRWLGPPGAAAIRNSRDADRHAALRRDRVRTSSVTVSSVAPDVVTVASGAATLASKDVGVRAITSMGTLALGGADAETTRSRARRAM